MGSKMTLAPQNIEYTFDALENLISLGYTQIFANCVYEEGWENKHGISAARIPIKYVLIRKIRLPLQCSRVKQEPQPVTEII